MTEAIKSLVAAQMAMGKAVKDTVNPAFRSKYADLASVQDACFPALFANGFAVMQPNGFDEHGEYVETIFAHVSGERFNTRVYLRLGKPDMQGYGSAMTYARRYGLMNLAGIAPEDDDGNAAAKNAAPRRAVVAAANDEPPVIGDPIRPLGMRDAWLDGIRDALPEGYTPPQFYGACASALEDAFKAKKTPAGVQAQWDKREALIHEMQGAHNESYLSVVDAFNAAMKRFEPDAEYTTTGDLGRDLRASLEMEAR